MFFGEKPFVFGLKVGPPGNREFKLLAGVCQYLNCLGVAKSLELTLCNGLQALHDRVVDPLVEELHVFFTIGEHIGDDPLQESLGQIHVVSQLEECRLGLDHPELGQMPRGVGVFRTERGAERVNFAQCRGVDFAFQLTRHGQVRGTIEKVLREVDRSLGIAGNIGRVERGDAEHLARPFAIARRDDGRVDVEKAVFLEKIVDRTTDAIANTHHGPERIGARTQMGPLAELFHRVTLFSGAETLRDRPTRGRSPRRHATQSLDPCPPEALISPRTETLQPAERCLISDS